MKINTQSRNKKRTILLVVIILVITVIVTGSLIHVFVYKDELFKNQPTDNSTIDKTDNASDNDKKPKNNSDEKPTDNQNHNDVQKETISGYITSKDVSGGTLILRTQINELLGSGTCNLRLTKGHSVITRTAQVIDSASTSTCYGFDIPVSELSSGVWEIEVHITSGSEYGLIKDEVTI